MSRYRLINRLFHIVRPAFAVFLVVAALGIPLVLTHDSVAQDTRPEGVANSGPTRVFMFGMEGQNGEYDVRKNGNALTSVTVGPSRVLRFGDNVTTGDIYTIMLTGQNPVPPSIPAGFAAVGGDDGCAALSWNTPDSGEYVYQYKIAWGPQAGQYTDSMTVSVTSLVVQGGTTSFSHCGLPTGHYCYVIRAHNGFDLWSAYTAASCTDVTNGNTQGPPAPQNVAVAETDPGCAEITWNASGDPTVTGFVVYYGDLSVAQGQAGAYTDSLDVGDVTRAELCGFGSGLWYFAVKGYTGAGVHSVYSAERSLAMTGVDETAPLVYNMTPADGATGVPLNQSIFFAVSDAQSGVDVNTISVAVNGEQLTQLSTIGNTSAYAVVAGPDQDFAASTTINVVVTASDLADPSNKATMSWSFETGSGTITDGDAPVFAGLDPANGSTRAEPDTDISVGVTDEGLGLDIASIEFYVNGESVPFQVDGDPLALTLIYENENAFQPGEVVDVRVVVCDLASPPNCTELSDYSFTIQSSFANLSEADMGAIIPNGYWANDPARPLEIRDMPASWSVRIFDTAGRQVRGYTNNDSDGMDWLWDFTNDGGQRVARAMYLVRVTDNDGKVRQSGRFLVQMDP